MILEYLAPGARRRTHTAGTTEASLLSLLDVEHHDPKVQKGVFEVNAPFGGRNREFNGSFGGAGRGRTADKGFADLCLTTWRPRLRRVHSTREKSRHHPLPALPAECHSVTVGLTPR